MIIMLHTQPPRYTIFGEHAELHPEIINRMVEEGHLVGNHTYSHIQLTKSNRETYKEELIKTNEILKEITGQEVQYVLPPSIKQYLLHCHKSVPIIRQFIYYPECCFNRCIIIIMH